MSATSKTALVLGANGRFGRAAVAAFAAGGWSVLAQARRAPVQPLPAGVQAVAIALDDGAALAAAARGAQVVVHALNPPYTRWAQELLPLARQGMDLARRLDALFMLPGNVYNFGASMPALLRADTPQRPSTRKGRIRCDLEAEMRSREARGQRSVVIRAGDFYGCGSGAWLDQVVVKSLAKGKLVYPGPLDVPHAWAYVPDLARAFVLAAQVRDLPAFADLPFPGHALTGRQLLAAIEQAAALLGIRPAAGFKNGSLPWALLRACGLLVPTWRELAEMEYLWRVPHELDGAALAAAVGVLPSTPIAEALPAALRDLGFGPQRRHALAAAA
jgi:nucleoside-diphosphate-sugar epimerase